MWSLVGLVLDYVDVHQSRGFIVLLLTRYPAGSISQLAPAGSIAGSVSGEVFVSLSLRKEVCLVAGERFLGQQRQQLWKDSTEFFLRKV